MLQELTDLDFDTYFDVASSNQSQQQQQQQSNRDILYHDDSASSTAQQNGNINSLSSLLNNNSNNNANNRPISSYQYAQQQQSFSLFDWDLNPNAAVVSSTPSQNQSPMQISPINSPQSSSDGYTSHTLSPQMMNSPPLYAYSSNDSQRIKDEASKALEGFFAKRSVYSSVIHNVPGINIPTTPITENPPISNASNASNLPSPPLENSLSGAFSTIDQWCQLRGQENVIHPLEMNNNSDNDKKNNEHQIRNWRRTSTRHQQLQQPQSNLFNRPEPGKQLKKVAHNAIERRYRNNINDRICELKNVVPALYKARIREKGEADDDSSESGDENEEEVVIVDGVEVAKKLNKATILRKATEYIQFLKNSNDTSEKENLILQQIIVQMPGGRDVLAHFLCQKNEFEKSEQERLARERREAQEREKTERQRLLRERAAQRAALAQLLPKPERRPYRRRQSSKNNAKPISKKVSVMSSSEDDHIGNSKMFMAAFMCITFFSTSPISSSSSNSSSAATAGSNNLHHASFIGSHGNQTSLPSINHPSFTFTTFDYWQIIRYTLYAFGIFYICIIPLRLRWLQPRPVNRPAKNCVDNKHHHYASEVPAAWNRLYSNLVSIKDKSAIAATANSSSDFKEKETDQLESTFSFKTLYDIFCYTLLLLVPRFLLALFYKNNAKPAVGPVQEQQQQQQLSSTAACVRMNEVECLGGNQNVTRLGMLHSCIEMLAQLHKLKLDEKQAVLHQEANSMARVYATIVMQIELCLSPSVSSLIAPYFWKRAIVNIVKKKSEKNQQQLISNDWLKSDCHDQVLQILFSRNAFTKTYDLSQQQYFCRNTFHSFVLPYITSPLDFILYWQELSNLQQCYFSYLNGTRPAFSQEQLDQVLNVSTTTTAAGHMLQWFVRVGLTLQSLGTGGQMHQNNLDALAEYTLTKIPQVNHQPSSNILRRHQTMIYNMMEAATTLQTNMKSSHAPQYLQKAADDRATSMECLEQIDDLTTSHNYEASLLLITTLAVHLRTLKALIIHQQTTFSANKRSSIDISDKLQASQASVYIAELRGQVLKDMQSPYTKSLSAKCKKHIQSYIYQADDTLSL